MARITYTQTAFNSGWLGKKMQRRIDVDQYRRGFRDSENLYLTAEGGLFSRNGTRYVAQAKSTPARLIPFIFSDESSYIMEFTNGAIRFYRDQEQMLSGGSPYEIVSPYTANDLPNIKWAQQGDVMYLVAGGGTIPPQKLTRTSPTTFSIADLVTNFGPVRDFKKQNITVQASATTGAITLTASAALFLPTIVGETWGIRDATGSAATTGYVTITGYTSSTLVNATVTRDLFGTTATPYWADDSWQRWGYPQAVAIHEQRLVFAGNSDEKLTFWFSRSAQAFEDFDINQGDADDAFVIRAPGRLSSIQWLLSDANFLLAGTYSGVVAIGSGNAIEPLSVQTALIKTGDSYGASKVQGVNFGNSPKFISASKKKLYQSVYDDISLKYTVNDLSVLNDNALSATVKYMDVQVEPYNWLWIVTEDGNLIGFLEESDQQVRGFHKHTTQGSFTSVAVLKQLGNGQTWVTVDRVVSGVTKTYVEFIEPDETRDAFLDSFVEYDGSLAADLTLSGLTGSINVTATAPIFNAGDVGRKIVTNPLGSSMVITGFVSSFGITCNVITDFTNASLSQGQWRITATTISGLSHLEGLTVTAKADGAVVGDYTVSSGSITVANEDAAGQFYIGLSYNKSLETLSYEAGSQNGDSITKLKRINRVGLSLYRSGASFEVGQGNNLEELDVVEGRSPQDLMDLSVPLYGAINVEDIVVSLPSTYDREAIIKIKQSLPIPLNIMAITAYMETNDS